MTDPLPASNLTILDRVGYTYFETDLNGNIISVNDALCRALGYIRDDLIGKPFSSFATTPQEEPILDIVQSSGQTQMGIEYHLRRKDGSTLFAEGGISLKLNNTGQAVGFRGVLHDISEHKQVEESLIQAKELAEKELEIGRQIQASFLPQALPKVPGWEIATHFDAARHVSGDFYDAFTLAGGSKVGVVVADVCDKGVGAALFMALFRSLIRAFSDQYYSPGWGGEALPDPSGESTGSQKSPTQGTRALKDTISRTNRYIIQNHGDTSMFATVFFGVFDPKSGSLNYINAGHEPPFVVGSEGIKTRLNPTGPAVGLVPDLDFGVEEIGLEPGDTLMAYTDGVVDALNSQSQAFSIERLAAILEQCACPTADLLEAVIGELKSHMGGAAQYDDITMLAVQRKLSA